MAEKKYSTLALLDILMEFSDEEHILSARQLLELLEQRHGLKLERRTLYSNMDILEQNGYRINRFETNGKGYYLERRQFDKGEVLLLCNAVHASHFISQNQSEDLIRKLLKTQSKYQAREFRDNVYMPNPRKTANHELMKTIALVSEAIRDGKCLSFVYMKYDRNKSLVPRRQERYVVEPRYIVYADSRAYMISTNPKYYDFTHYRLDRMGDAKVLEKKTRDLPENADAYEYAKNKLFMFGGEAASVQFLCRDSVMDQMIDLFGSELVVIPQKEEQFIIRVNASRTGALYLAQQYMDAIEILEPEELREEFLQTLRQTLNQYEGKGVR